MKSRLFLALLSLAFLAGCGWRLEGTERLPRGLRRVVLTIASPYGTFGRRLRGLLESAGGRVSLHAAAPGAAQLAILSASTGQRVVNVNSQGVPAVYEVSVRILYTLSRNGRVLLPPTTIHLTTPYFYQPLAPLAMAEESTRIVHHMEREAASLLVLRLLHFMPPSRPGGAPPAKGAHGSPRAGDPPPPRGFPRDR